MSFQISNKAYDILSNTVKLVLPALGTLYFTIASVWDLPYGEQVVGSVAAIATFLGVVLAVSKRGWQTNMDGSLVVDETDPNKDMFSLEVNTPFDELKDKSQITLKVDKTV